jgi:hypothetical protein
LNRYGVHRCSNCGKTNIEGAKFYRNAARDWAGGLDNFCSVCRLEANRQWRANVKKRLVRLNELETLLGRMARTT